VLITITPQHKINATVLKNIGIIHTNPTYKSIGVCEYPHKEIFGKILVSD